MNQGAWDLRGFGPRLVAASVVVSLLLPIMGGTLIGQLVPLFEAVFSVAKPGFEASIHVEPGSDGGQIITASAYTTAVVALDAGHALAPSTRLTQTVWIDVLHALIPAVILLTGLLAWPLTCLREIFTRALFGVPAVLLAFFLTTPLYLAGRVDVLVRELAEVYGVKPSPYPSPLMIWMIFTELGGLWLLPIVLATVCIDLGRRVLSTRQAVRGNTLVGSEVMRQVAVPHQPGDRGSRTHGDRRYKHA